MRMRERLWEPGDIGGPHLDVLRAAIGDAEFEDGPVGFLGGRDRDPMVPFPANAFRRANHAARVKNGN